MKAFLFPRGIAVLVAAGFLGLWQIPAIAQAPEPKKSPGELRFEEKCRTVAGEKIYKTVPDVEGLVLLKVRPVRGDRELSDRNWRGAAFARELSGSDFITTFLGYEYSSSPKGEPVRKDYRGYISTDRRPGGLPGYRYVDVIDEKDGQRYRYTGRWEEPWQYDKNYLKGYIKFFLDKSPAPNPAPRYGVTYEDHVIPEDRALNIASSTIKVIDLKTQDVLGELTRYAWSPGGPSYNSPVPWLTAYRCPDHAVGTDEATRKFVDQILIPRKEK